MAVEISNNPDGDALERFPRQAPHPDLLPHKIYFKYWYRLLLTVAGLFLFVLTSLFVFGFISARVPLVAWVFFSPLCGLGAIGVLGTVRAWRPIAVLFPDRIRVTTLLGSRTLGRSEIVGVTANRSNRGGDVFALVPRDNTVRFLPVSAVVRGDALGAAWLAGAPEVNWPRQKRAQLAQVAIIAVMVAWFFVFAATRAAHSSELRRMGYPENLFR